MTPSRRIETTTDPGRPGSPRPPEGGSRAGRLTVAAGLTLLVINLLHAAVFVAHPWWGMWLAGPFDGESFPPEVLARFWALPGGFVVPGMLLALLLLRAGRRGTTVPHYVGIGLGGWAIVCTWVVGPSGFLLLLVPAVLLLIDAVRTPMAVDPAS